MLAQDSARSIDILGIQQPEAARVRARGAGSLSLPERCPQAFHIETRPMTKCSRPALAVVEQVVYEVLAVAH
jgi:hypothetical protein